MIPSSNQYVDTHRVTEDRAIYIHEHTKRLEDTFLSRENTTHRTMEKSTRTLFITIVITSMLLGFGNSDLAQDREECTNQLIELSTCIPYVGGDAKAPTKDCCAGFGQVIRKSEKCVCILVRDKDDPQLGIKINATLAAHLPSACHITAPNITDCISILHLPRNSTLAKEFENLGRIEDNYNSTSPTQIHKDGTGGGKAEPVKSNGWKEKSWLGVELLIYLLVSLIFF